MSWSTISPGVGMRPQEYDASAGTLRVRVPIPHGDFEPENSQIYLRNTLGMIGVAGRQLEIDKESAELELSARGQVAGQFLLDVAEGRFAQVDGQLSADPKRKRVLDIGKVADHARLRPVSANELQFGKEYGDVVVGSDHVVREGGFRIRLSDALTILRESKLVNGSEKAWNNRLTMLIHGRAGTQHFTKPRLPGRDSEADNLTVGAHFKGNANVSIAGYTGIFQDRSYVRKPDGTFEELPWQNIAGSGLVEKFSLGLLERYNKNLIMYADPEHKLPAIKPSDVWVDIDVYQPYSSETESNFFANWHDLSTATKERLHEKGADLVDVLRLDDATMLAKLFDYTRLSKQAAGDDKSAKMYFANVLSPNGITPIGVLNEEREHSDEELIEGVRLEGRYRDLPEEYDDLSEILTDLGQATPEGARVVAIDTLPNPEMLNVLYKEGVRGIVFKDLSSLGPFTGSAALNETMNRLTKEGMQFIQSNEQDELRAYYGRQMVKYSRLEKHRQADFRIVHYGSANEASVARHETATAEFASQLICMLPKLIKAHTSEESRPVTLVSEDGAGPGNMRVTSTTATENKISTSGMAIFAEAVDNQTSRVSEYDAYWMYPVNDVAIRQRDMDLSGTLVVVHPGGLGTFFEAVTSGLSIQLLEKIAIPIIIVDPHQKLNGYKQLLEDMCTPDEEGAYMAKPWIKELFVFCESYDEARAEVEKILPNLKKHWYRMLEDGMSLGAFKDAVSHGASNLADRGVNQHHSFIVDQAEEFIKEVEERLIPA